MAHLHPLFQRYLGLRERLAEHRHQPLVAEFAEVIRVVVQRPELLASPTTPTVAHPAFGIE